MAMAKEAFLFHVPKKIKQVLTIDSIGQAIRNESCPYKSLAMFVSMHRQGMPLGSFSLVYALKSAASLHNILQIRHLHCFSLKVGLSENVYVATSLLNGYAMVSMMDACGLFDEMPERNTVAWNTMISGYLRIGNVKTASYMFKIMPYRNIASWSTFISDNVKHGRWVTGLDIFRDMMFKNKHKPDQMTLNSVLSGCSRLVSMGLLLGRSVHGFIVKYVKNVHVKTGTALVDMYARCGYMKYANQVFDLMEEKNVVTWTALICGSAQYSTAKETMALFEKMRESSVRANELTFTGILKACANSGLVHEGRIYFKMIEEYDLEPNIHHIACIIDLLGNAGLLEEAYEVIRSMKYEPNIVIWGSFLTACKEHNKPEMAERVIEDVLRNINPKKDGGVYFLISDIYKMNQKWDAAEKMTELMIESRARKIRGSSFINTQ